MARSISWATLGEGPDLQEGVTCFDAETGKKLWEKRYDDFSERYDLPALRDLQPDGGRKKPGMFTSRAPRGFSPPSLPMAKRSGNNL